MSFTFYTYRDVGTMHNFWIICVVVFTTYLSGISFNMTSLQRDKNVYRVKPQATNQTLGITLTVKSDIIAPK